MTIRETVETIARLVGFEGELRWDPSKPDGQPRRRVDASRAEQLLGWRAQMPFDEGMRRTLDWYLANRDEANGYPELRGLWTVTTHAGLRSAGAR